MSPDELHPIAEACRRLGGVSRSTVYREHAAGRIRFTKVRGSTFVRDSEIERYLRSQDQRKPRRAA